MPRYVLSYGNDDDLANVTAIVRARTASDAFDIVASELESQPAIELEVIHPTQIETIVIYLNPERADTAIIEQVQGG